MVLEGNLTPLHTGRTKIALILRREMHPYRGLTEGNSELKWSLIGPYKGLNQP